MAAGDKRVERQAVTRGVNGVFFVVVIRSAVGWKAREEGWV